MSIFDEGLDALGYLKKIEGEVVKRIDRLGKSGKAADSVKLKANVALLNKVLPDLTRSDLEIRSEAPYDRLLKAITEEKEEVKPEGE